MLDDLVGQYVLCRCYSAGVHCGTLTGVDPTGGQGATVTLTNSRRLWYWKAKGGIALSGVAQHGITGESKVDTVNPVIVLTGVIEVIPMSAEARGTVENA